MVEPTSPRGLHERICEALTEEWSIFLPTAHNHAPWTGADGMVCVACDPHEPWPCHVTRDLAAIVDVEVPE